MTRSTARRTAAALTVLVVAGAAAPPAHGAPRRAQQTYTCAVGLTDGSTDETQTESFGAAMTLDVPDSVPAGGTVSLTGSFEFRLPDSYRERFAMFGFTEVEGASDTLGITMEVGGRRVAHIADRWASGPQRVGNPIVVTGSTAFPTFRVPEDARGTLRLSMPGNDATGNTVRKDPERVAFTAVATTRGPTSYSYALACYLPGGEAPNVIAEVPIVAPGGGGGGGGDAEAGTSGSGSSGSAGGTRGGSARGRTTSGARRGPSGTSTTRSATTTTPRATRRSSTNPFGASSPASADDVVAGGPETTAGAEPSARAAGPVLAADTDTRDGIRLRRTWLWAIGLAALLGSLTWALVLRMRLRSLLDERDG
ncbi:DUF6801 domain-containing protein [Conexibacter sp. SYSU D00693]|uniref:DUF6801 domain-containing protein n=1 Tax=Conexibacter sp. SYSU D00693 TaxID=2812560 RepID=UPI00196BA228|nr:DUF6801 domain-containing protein [Conexibacter sp. SYSU D00693]